jgi:O-antigen/teichoic acid export membrane protein
MTRLAKMAGALAASDLVRAAIRFGTSLIVARGLGRIAFGEWTLWLAVASALTALFDLGLRTLLIREAGRDENRVGMLVLDAASARLALFLPIAVALIAIATSVGGVAPARARAAAFLTAAGLVAGCAAAVHRASPRRLAAILTIESGGAVVQAIATALLVAQGRGVDALLDLAAWIQLLQAAAALVVWRATAHGDRLARPSVARAWRMVRQAWPFAISGVLANAQARVAPLLVGALAGTGEVASFGVAARIEGVARRLPSAAFGAAFPLFAGVSGADSDRLRRRMEEGVRWFALASAAIIVVAAAPLVRVTYGERFAAAAWPLAWAAAGLVPALMNSSREVFLFATGRERTALRWSAVALAVQAAGCLLLVPRLGASGAMIALAAGEIAVWIPLRNAPVRAVA